MNVTNFDQQIQNMQQRLAQLQQHIGSRSQSSDPEMITAVFQELDTALEELYQQNEALAIAHQAVEAEHQRYKALFEFAPSGYLVTDLAGMIQEANYAAATLLNANQNSLIGKPLLLYIPKDERQTLYTALNCLDQTQQVQKYELRLQPCGQAPVYVALMGVVVRDWQDKPLYLQWMMYDITSRKQLEESLQQLNHQLEFRVQARTAELRQTNEQLQQEITERQQVETALVASEAQYRLLFETNPHPMWVYDAETLAFLAVNEAATCSYGYSQAEFLAMTIQDIRPPEEVPSLLEFIQQLNSQRKPPRIWQHRKRDGTTINVEITSNSLVFAGRKARLVLANDVTEWQRTQEILQASEATNRALLETIPDLIIRMSRDGTYLDFKPATDFKTVMPIQDMLGQNVCAIMPPLIAQQRLHYVEQALQTGEPQAYEYQLFWDGILTYEEARIVVCQENEVLVIVRDISDRKRAEEALRKSEELYRTLASNFPNGAVLLFDHNLRYTLAEGMGLAEAGFSREMLTGKTIWEVLPPEVCGLLEPSYRASLAGMTTVQELSFSDRIYRLHVLPVKNENQEVLAGMVMTQNITQQKQAEAALHKAKDELKTQVQQRTLKLCETIDQLWHEIAERQRIEDALRQSEERFRTLVETTSNWVWEIDENSVYTYVNPKVEDILGFKPSDVLGKQFFDFMPPAEAQRMSQPFSSITASQQPFACIENTNIHQDGHCVILETSGIPFFDAEGRFKGYRGVNRDITVRKQAEQALRESEARFRLLAENSTDMISRHTPNGIYLYISPACQVLLGYHPEALLGTSAYDLFHPDDLAAIAQIHQNTLNVSDINTITYRIRHQQGQYIWFESTLRSIRNEPTGEVLEIHVASRDVTQRKRAEEINALLATAVKHAADAIEITDPQARFQYVNPAFEEMTGYTCAEVLHKTPSVLLRGQDDNGFYEAIWNTISKGQVWSGAMLGKRKDGSLYNQETTISPVQNPAGEITHYVAVKRDITERKRVEVEIQKALAKERELSELKSRFVAMTSHEFRTPLTIILSSAKLLRDYGQGWTEAKKLTHLQRIVIAGERMTKLLDDILILGKADAGKLQCQPRPLSLTQFCCELVEDLQLSDNGQHLITFSRPETNPEACMDEKLLQRIFGNLLTNALKYSPAGSSVSFELTYEDRSAIFRVQDQGIGIPVLDQERLFESFQRASNVGTIPGTGLGLAIVKKCVDLQGGEITVDSEVDMGTLITVKLPLVQIEYAKDFSH